MLNMEPQQLVGTWRRFGVAGPVYEILARGKPLSAGEETFRIRVVETGEELDYKLSDVLDDPAER